MILEQLAIFDAAPAAPPAESPPPLSPWMQHTAICDTCDGTAADIRAVRAGSLHPCNVTLACRVGIRLMPMSDLDTATEEFTRQGEKERTQRLLALRQQ